MTNERKIWLVAVVVWTAIVWSLAAPAQPRQVEMACAGLSLKNTAHPDGNRDPS